SLILHSFIPIRLPAFTNYQSPTLCKTLHRNCLYSGWTNSIFRKIGMKPASFGCECSRTLAAFSPKSPYGKTRCDLEVTGRFVLPVGRPLDNDWPQPGQWLPDNGVI